MEKSFRKAMQERRSVYAIDGEKIVPEKRIRELLENSLLHVPSAFNCQSQRAVLLFDDQHRRVWSIVLEALRAIVPADAFAATEAKIQGFAAGYGTILYYDDQEATAELARTYPAYAEFFPLWAQQANGMLQFAVWTQIEAEGLGATLQHYNLLIEQALRREFGLPETWLLIAQMPFGRPVAAPPVKEFMPLAERLRVIQ